MLRDFDADRLTLVKANGEVTRTNFPALVSGNTIFIGDTTLPMEIGDHLLRELENELTEDFEIIDPKFYKLGQDAHFQVKVRKTGAPKRVEAVIQHITNNFHGANSRVNIHSADNSVNISNEISAEKLREFVEQVRPVISLLPQADQAFVSEQIEKLDAELESEKPSKMKILGALQSIKTVTEGAAGNLVASGIGSLIATLVS